MLKAILKKTKKRTDRTLGQMVKAKLYRQKSHEEAYTYTLTKREKGKKLYIYILKKKMKRATQSRNKSTNDNKL